MKATDLFHRFDQFKKALAKLREALLLPESEIVRDAAIQRFEFTYEMAWKTIKLYLFTKDIELNSPKDTIIAAFENHIIEDGNGWSKLQRMRNLTSHTYDSSSSFEVYNYLVSEGLELFDRLKIRLNELIGGEDDTIWDQ